MGLIPQSQRAFGIGFGLISAVFGFSLLGILQFDASGLVLGLILLIIAVVMFLETYKEDRIKFPPQRLGDTIVTILFAVTGVAGIVSLTWGIIFLPLPLKNVLGFVLLLDAVVVMWESKN